jgi:hypothetical protein
VLARGTKTYKTHDAAERVARRVSGLLASVFAIKDAK